MKCVKEVSWERIMFEVEENFVENHLGVETDDMRLGCWPVRHERVEFFFVLSLHKLILSKRVVNRSGSHQFLVIIDCVRNSSLQVKDRVLIGIDSNVIA